MPQKSGWPAIDSAWPAQSFQDRVNPGWRRRRREPRHRSRRQTNLHSPVLRRQPGRHFEFLKDGSGRDHLARLGLAPIINPVVQLVPGQTVLLGKRTQRQTAGAVASYPARNLLGCVASVSGRIVLHSGNSSRAPALLHRRQPPYRLR